MNLADFHFLRPAWLLGLLPLAWLAWRLREAGVRTAGWDAVCDRALQPFVLVAREGTASPLGRRALLAAAALGLIALAGPTWERLPVPVYRDDSSVVVVLDLSLSMNAADVAPSRLGRARFEITDLLNRQPTVQSALVVYARDAYAVTPLTTDVGTLLAQLPVLSPALMPAQGSRADRGVAEAASLLEQAGERDGEVLLVTDGVDAAQLPAIETLARERQFSVSVLAVGTPGGAPVPKLTGGFIKGPDHRMILSKLEAGPLEALSGATGGIYVASRTGEADIDRLAAYLARPAGLPGGQASEVQNEQIQSDRWRDQGPWLLLAALPLAALAFRRGMWLALLLPAVMIPLTRPAQALEWEGLWARDDQRAAAALAAGEADRAAALFEDPAWRSAAHHRAAQYEQAIEALAGRTDAESLYNRGNALARLGRLEEAMAAYNSALAAEPGHADARHNRDVVAEALQAQQPPPQQGGPSQQDEQDGQDAQDSPGEGESQSEGGASSGGEESEATQGGEQATQPGAEPGQSAAPEPQGGESDGAEQPQASGSGNAEEPSPYDELEPADSESESGKEDAAPPSEAGGAGEDSGESAEVQPGEHDETAQATEQWLRRVPDDPGGLLRRKFKLEARRSGRNEEEAQPW